MAEQSLRSCRILVVEDEYLLADELSYGLHEAGAVVIGPAPSVEGALKVIQADGRLDCAILDMNLGGKRVDPVADVLAGRGVPFLFVTGYDSLNIPARFSHVVCCAKPVSMAAVTGAIRRVIHAGQ